MTWVAPASYVPLQSIGSADMNAISANFGELWVYTDAGQIAVSTAADSLGVLDANGEDYKGIYSDGTTWTIGYAPMFGASVYNSANISITKDTYTTIYWDTENYDVSPSTEYHTTNDSKLTNPLENTNYYLCDFLYMFEANNTGLREAQIMRNGYMVARDSRNAVSGATTGGSVSILLNMAEGDYIEAQVWQNSGGNINFATNYSSLTMTFWGGYIT